MQSLSQPEEEAPYITAGWIKSNPFCEEWLDSLKPSSLHLYASGLAKFCRHYMMTPDQLTSLPLEDLKKKIRHYISHLKKTARQSAGKHKKGDRHSVNSIRSFMCGPQSFTEFLELPLLWKQINKALPDGVPNNLRGYTHEEVKRLLFVADERGRVCILVMVSSGIRVGAFSELCFKNIIRLGPEYNNIAMLVVYGKSKKKYQYISLLSPEALQAIDEYRALREKLGEKITDDSPLIIQDLFYRHSKQAVKAKGINSMMKRLMLKAKLPFDELQPDHAFRRFFNTCCIIAHIDNRYSETMMGHSLKLNDIYMDVDNPIWRKEIIAEYMKVLPAITISDDARAKLNEVKVTQELEELKKNSAPKELIESLQKQVTELQQREKQTDKEVFKRMLLEWVDSPEYKAKIAAHEREMKAG